MALPVKFHAYPKGATIRCTVRFKVGGVFTDPTTLTFRQKKPDDTVTVKTLAANPTNVIRDSIGVFYIDVTGSQSGTWTYRWEGTGSADGVAERSFLINHSEF